MAILFIAAEAQELKSLANRLTGLRALKWPLGYAQEGILAGRRILLAASGAGPKLAAQALEIGIRAIQAADLQSSALEAVVSVGLCGALRPDIPAAQVIVAHCIKSVDSAEVFPCGSLESDLPFISGDLISQDRIAHTSEEKAQLARQYQAIAVEMEAFGIAQRAKRAGLPFFCIKVVSDRADESFRLDFNQVRAPDGRIVRGKIVGKAIVRPALIPELLRLKRRADRAAGILGDFIVSCRFSFQLVHAGSSDSV